MSELWVYTFILIKWKTASDSNVKKKNSKSSSRKQCCIVWHMDKHQTDTTHTSILLIYSSFQSSNGVFFYLSIYNISLNSYEQRTINYWTEFLMEYHETAVCIAATPTENIFSIIMFQSMMSLGPRGMHVRVCIFFYWCVVDHHLRRRRRWCSKGLNAD